MKILLSFVIFAFSFCPPLWAQTNAPTQPLKKVELLLDWYPQSEHGGYFDALARGLYQQEGLDVKIVAATPGQVGETMLLSNIAQFGLSTSDSMLLARSRGLPLVALMTTMQHDPKAVLVHEESPVKTFADLENHSIEVRPNSAWFLYLLKKYNLKNVRELRNTFNVSTFLHDPNYIQECFITSEPFFVQQHGVQGRILLVKDIGYDTYRVLYATSDYTAKNPEIAQAFVTASIAGWTHYLQDPTVANALILKYNPQMTQAQLDFSHQALVSNHMVTGDPTQGEVLGQQTDARYAAMYKILREVNVIDHDFDYQQTYRTDLAQPKN